MLLPVLGTCFDFSYPMRITGVIAQLDIGFNTSCNIKFLNEFQFVNFAVTQSGYIFYNNRIVLVMYLLKYNITSPQNPIILVKYAYDAQKYFVPDVRYSKNSTQQMVRVLSYAHALHSGSLAFSMSVSNELLLFDNTTDSIPRYSGPDAGGAVYNKFPVKNIMRTYELNFSVGTSEIINDFTGGYCYQEYNYYTGTYSDTIACNVGSYCNVGDTWNFTCFNEQFQKFIIPNKYVSAVFYFIAAQEYLLRLELDYMIITASWDLTVIENTTNLQITEDDIKYVYRYTLLGVELSDFINIQTTIQIDEDYFELQYMPLHGFFKFTCDVTSSARQSDDTIFEVYSKQSQTLQQQQSDYSACKLRLAAAFRYLQYTNGRELNITLTNVAGTSPLARVQVTQNITVLRPTQFLRWQIERDGIYVYFDAGNDYYYEYSGFYYTEADNTTKKVYFQQVYHGKFRLQDSYIEENLGSGEEVYLRVKINDQDLDIQLKLNQPRDVPVYVVMTVALTILILALIFANNVSANT